MDLITNDIIIKLIKSAEIGTDKIKIMNHRFEHNIIKEENNWYKEVSKLIVRYTKNKKRHTKSFFVKDSSKSSSYENVQPIELFNKEARVYESILPKFKVILSDERFAPRHYHTNENYILILEDLSQLKYRINDRTKQLDFEHCCETLKLLAKFHAVSVEVAKTTKEISKGIGKELVYTSSNIFSEKFCDHLKEVFSHVIRNADQLYANVCDDQLSHLRNIFMSRMKDELKVKPNSFNVLNHGDFWTNNIMFEYDRYGTIKNVKFVDFQLCRWNSPAVDIIYFVMSSMRYEVFEKHFDLLLEIYASTLNKTLKYMQCDKICNIDELRWQIDNMPNFWIFSLLYLTSRAATKTEISNYFRDTNFVKEESFVTLSKKWISYFIKKGILPPKVDEISIAVKTFVEIFQKQKGITVISHKLENNVIEAGNNYCSEIVRLKVEYRNDGQILEKNVLLKCPILSPNYIETKKIKAYDKEIYMYEAVLSRLYQFWDEENLSPQFYGGTKLQSLILEDLNELGFHIHDKTLRLDLEHSTTALKTLARFHGLSLKYLQIHRANKKEIKYLCSNIASVEGNSMEGFYFLYEKFLKVSADLFPENILVKLKDNSEILIKLIKAIMTPNENGLNVIKHGDYWNNNILFRYDEQGRVLESKIVDFQLSSIGSPVYDLIYFFATSVRLEVFKEHRNELLNSYLDTLNETISLLKLDCEYTRNDMETDFQKYKFIYVFCVGVQLQFSTCDTIIFSDALHVTSKEYVTLVKTWITYLEEENVL